MFTGSKCDKLNHPRGLSEDILEVLNPDSENEPLKKSDAISLPILFSDSKEDSNDDDNDSRSIGEIEQNKIVDYLSRLVKNIPFLPEIVKRFNIMSVPEKRSNIPRMDSYLKRSFIPRSSRSLPGHRQLQSRSNIYSRPRFQYLGKINPFRQVQRRTLSNRYWEPNDSLQPNNVFHYRNIERNAIPGRYKEENSNFRYPRHNIFREKA